MPPIKRVTSPVKSLPTLSPYQAHCARWKNGCGSDQCGAVNHVVLVRGTLPCDVLFIGEAPGECLAGDSLIDVAFRDKSKYPEGIPISELVGEEGIKVYSYSTKLKRFCIADVARVWKTGRRKVFKVSFFWWGAPGNGKGGRKKYFGSIKVTSNHPFLLKDGTYRSIDNGLGVGSRLQPFYRHKTTSGYGWVGTHHTTMVKEPILLMRYKEGRDLVEGEEVHHVDRNKLNDSWGNISLQTKEEHARIHGYEDNQMFDETNRETHRQVVQSAEYRSKMSEKMKEVLTRPDVYEKRLKSVREQAKRTSATIKEKFAKDPVYYYRYLRGRKFRNSEGYSESALKEKFLDRFPNHTYPPDENHEVFAVEEIGVEDVYDMEVPKLHNFVANGVFVHNSEDVIGQPFIGPAGRLLDEMIDEALGDEKPRMAWVNLVGCIPRDENGDKATEPKKKQIEKCRPRLREIALIADPETVAFVGKLSEKHGPAAIEGMEVKTFSIQHPAFILRSNVADRGLLIQRCIATLASELEDVGKSR